MATLKDVAKASGLTVGTVSRVLNNRGYISDKTREKVYRVMKGAGAANITVGVITLVVGIVTGILLIVTGGRLLSEKSKILF